MCDLPTPPIDPLIEDCIKNRNYKVMLKQVSSHKVVKRTSKNTSPDCAVRSIQRLTNSNHFDNETIYKKYVQWLPSKFKYLIKAHESRGVICFYFSALTTPLLILKKVDENENIDRVKFHIIGGLLTKTTDTGWLEFRQVAGESFTLASIHGFIPSLPWYIYKYTQAPLHEFVMKKFGESLSLKA